MRSRFSKTFSMMIGLLLLVAVPAQASPIKFVDVINVMGDLPTAERELTKALVMGGSDCVAAHYHLARAYVLRGDGKEASRALKAYLEEAPKGEYVKEARELAKKLSSEVKKSTK